MHYKVEIETREWWDVGGDRTEASVTRGPSFTRRFGTQEGSSRDEAYEKIRRRVMAFYGDRHTFDFIHTPA